MVGVLFDVEVQSFDGVGPLEAGQNLYGVHALLMIQSLPCVLLAKLRVVSERWSTEDAVTNRDLLEGLELS